MIRNNNRIVKIFLRHSLPLVVVVLLLGGGAMSVSFNFIRSNALSQMQQTLGQVESYYDVILNEIDGLSLMFRTNPSIMLRLRQAFSDNGNLNLDSYREIKLIRSFLEAPANARPYIQTIYVYLENPQQIVFSSKQAFTSLSHLYDNTWFSSYQDLSTQENESYLVIPENKISGNEELIRILSPITSQENSRIGVIILDIDKDTLASAYELKDGESLTVRNRKGEILFIQDSKIRSHYDDRDMLFFSSSSGKYGWEYTLSVYKPTLYRLSRTLFYMTGALTLSALLLGLYLTHRTNHRERVFISNVMNQLKQVSDSELSTEKIENYSNVFDYLNHHVIRTFLEQDYLRWQKEAIEYRALQMQINPHFLYNTLDTINWKAIKLSEGENDVSRMILLLTKLLKYSLQYDDFSGVPLSKELEMARYYLSLQEIRFKDRFSYAETIDPGLLDVKVPGLLLQPILENAFNHGFVENQILSISLIVSEVTEEGKIRIEIADNGKKMTNPEILSINESIGDALNKKSSLGLMNIKKRLTLLTRDSSPLYVSSGEESGVKVTIELPLERS